MKTILVLALSLFSISAAHAGYSSDVSGKSVRCTGTQTIVIINTARTEITVINTIDSAHSEKYTVASRDSDGDTFVSYTAQNSDVVLAFDDQGDTLTYKGQRPTHISCPK